MASERDPTMDECIRHCTDCHAACIETVQYCLEQGGAHADPAHLALMATCADICRTSADAMLRGTAAHVHTCRACAAICDLCAASCESMGDDGTMQRCAQACRRCAASCARMAA
ncbi:four-helix bundle copper-binding protein [Cognatilysobacter segetis]|uniref:four-helix bundle copper-binding protein n=1 Tax=Cognatilysobacter segetis TaxID=2492394 RepID=UPI001EE3EF8D|nr:four-helix bundle copper-binding protein [Lysobacter segetis]